MPPRRSPRLLRDIKPDVLANNETSYISRLPREILANILTRTLTYPERLCKRITDGHGSENDEIRNDERPMEDSDLSWGPMTDQYHWSVEICSSSHETSCYRFYIQRERIPSKASLLAVLGVCQEWCYTGQEIFYKRNHFHFTSLGQFVEVLETDMTLRQRQLVSQITIVWVHYSDAYRYIPNKLKDFVSLRNLRLLLYHNAREPSSIRGNLGKSTCLGRLKDLRNLESLTVVCPENDKCSMCKEQQERLEAKYVRLSKSSKKATPAS